MYKRQLAKRLESVIRNSIQAGEPGIALYVETKGKTVYKTGFGLANTAMCILLLEKDQKLSFDDPISRFFPEIPSPAGRKILLCHLFTRSSAILDYEVLMDENRIIRLRYIDVLNLLENPDTTYFTHGNRFCSSALKYCSLSINYRIRFIRKIL